MGLAAVTLCVLGAGAFVKFGPAPLPRGLVEARPLPGRHAQPDAETAGNHTAEVPATVAPASPARSPELQKLTELRAYKIWVDIGRPTGKLGEAVKDKNWAEAEKQINAEVEARAFELWVQQGRPVGPAGESASKKNRHDAEVQLLKETEEEYRRKPIH